MITKHEAAIISAYTGILLGEFPDLHRYACSLIGVELTVEDMAKPRVAGNISERSKADFLALKVEL